MYYSWKETLRFYIVDFVDFSFDFFSFNIFFNSINLTRILSKSSPCSFTSSTNSFIHNIHLQFFLNPPIFIFIHKNTKYQITGKEVELQEYEKNQLKNTNFFIL